MLVKNSFCNKKIHFIGVGGISISALAKLVMHYGAKVSGSDAVDSERLDELRAKGAKIWVGSKPNEIDADFVVYTSAVSPNDAELVFAKNVGILTYERHEFLGIVSTKFKKVIAISGTHGKTTTTGMLTAIFYQAKKLFTSHIGGDVLGFSNLVTCGDEFFITEACEFRRSFLSLYPDLAVILNIESDHPDCFHNEEELLFAFKRFASQVKSGGAVVIKSGLEHICENEHIITFTNENSRMDKCTYSSVKQENGILTSNAFDVFENGDYVCSVDMHLKGEHNVSNAIAAFAVARQCGVSVEDIKIALEEFRGVKRRFEIMGTVNGAEIVFDYAHHPSEIRAAIAVARRQYRRLAVVFQPHTYSRTKSLLPAFLNCFSLADLLAILPTYPARESESDGMSAENLFVELLQKHERNALTARYNLLSSLEDGARFVMKAADEYDCILVLGAGDVIDVAHMLKYDLPQFAH